MSRIEDIIEESRQILGDTSGDRYTNDILMAYLNKGIRHINKEAKILKSKSYIKLENNIAYYDVSDIVLEFDRIQYMDRTILAKSEAELDRYSSTWSTETGTDVKFVTLDRVKSGAFKIYPKITDNVLNIVSANQVYGAIIDINYTDDLFEIPVNTLESYAYKYMTIYYIKKPNTVLFATLDEDLEFDTIVDDALAYYISGKALRSASDAQNRAFSAEQFSLYDTELSSIKKKQSSNNNSVKYKDIQYKGFV